MTWCCIETQVGAQKEVQIAARTTPPRWAGLDAAALKEGMVPTRIMPGVVQFSHPMTFPARRSNFTIHCEGRDPVCLRQHARLLPEARIDGYPMTHSSSGSAQAKLVYRIQIGWSLFS